MENFNLIMGLITSVLLLLISLTGTVLSLVKAVKNKKIAIDKTQITEFLFSAVLDAEKLFTGGEEKKKAVMEKYEQFAKEKGIVLDLDAISKGVDDIIDYVNALNKTKKK